MKLEIYGNEKEGFIGHGESTDEHLEPCPWCGSRDIEISNTHTPSYWGQCQSCGAQGPSSDYPREQVTKTRIGVRRQHQRVFLQAVERWNIRLAPTPTIHV